MKLLRFLTILLTLYFGGLIISAKAHQVEQFYAEHALGSPNVTIQFDVAYAMPDIRDDPNSPQPRRSWLLDQTPGQHAILKKESERYLRDYLQFQIEDQKLDFHISFPDFDVSPPSFIQLMNQGAYYRIILTPQVTEMGKLTLQIKNPNAPALLIARESGGKSTFQTLTPNKSYLLDEQIPPTQSEINLFIIGFKHVIPDGLDHILFIIGICLSAATIRQMLWQSLLFTGTHALSMALVISDHLPIYDYAISNYIEPLIALSIAFIALEVLMQKTNLKLRFTLIGIFGLIHGFGFAGALGSSLESILTTNWITPLLIANLGIEAAQALLVIATFTILFYLRKMTSNGFATSCTQVIALSISFIGMIWFFQRLP